MHAVRVRLSRPCSPCRHGLAYSVKCLGRAEGDTTFHSICIYVQVSRKTDLKSKIHITMVVMEYLTVPFFVVFLTLAGLCSVTA